ncbi:SGNH/GDSL hydrolase family protein [Rubellimicrobium arenae]|uniref:SGNH/GDSL hydrolase family protein n=1 Tax=Rubellimicrobium arenae TaxID=2817372 RepID=UPI001B308DAE|nr:SGNH/GDSL hydrolase family protein [Rubellimicrobium arenae]
MTLIGRTLSEPGNPAEGEGGFRHQWPGVYATGRFDGDTVVIGFDDGLNRYRIAVDGEPGPVIVVNRPGRRSIRLAGLGPGAHLIRIDKISESPDASGRFIGIGVPEGHGRPPPAPLDRQIEFIGDSDTVGYGNLSLDRDCAPEDLLGLTDTREAFGPRVARHFHADYETMAQSGIGVVRNYDGALPGRTIPLIYPRALPDEAAPKAGDRWAPDIIVLALGSNDFATPLTEGERWADNDDLRTDFQAGYVEFLKAIRRAHPGAYLLLGAWEQYGPDYMLAHQAIVRDLKAQGEARVDLIILPQMDRSACDWHPSLSDHETVAQALIDYIEARPGMWDDAAEAKGH